MRMSSVSVVCQGTPTGIMVGGCTRQGGTAGPLDSSMATHDAQGAAREILVRVADSIYNLDLDAAWKRVLGEASSDAIPDVLRLDDQKTHWPALKEAIISQLDAGSYHPAPPRLVEVPKDEFTSRPIAM